MEVLADAREVRDHVDAVLAQVLRGTDAGEQQELRRSDRPARDDDLAGTRALDRALAHPLDSDAADALEEQPPRVGPGQQAQVRVLLDVAQVRRRRAVADPVLDRELHERDAVLRAAVVVRVERDPALLGGLRDRAVDRIRLEPPEDVHGTALDALEDGPHVRPGPALGAVVGPPVVVGRRAAHPDHRVQAARAAEDAAARPGQPAIGGMRLGHRLDRPVLLGEPELVHAARVVDGGVDVGPAGLEQQDAHVAAIDQPPRRDRTGRPGADHDHVRREVLHARSLWRRRRRVSGGWATPARAAR